MSGQSAGLSLNEARAMQNSVQCNPGSNHSMTHGGGGSKMMSKGSGEMPMKKKKKKMMEEK